MTDIKKSSLFQHPAQLFEMAQRLIADGKADLAMALARSAAEQSDGDSLVRAIGKEILSRTIDKFHARMLRDDARNAAYAAGIAAAAPGRIVLDIGTGSGLLSMLAARAGARHVYACELDQRLAITAREIIAANGLADHITVFQVHSSKLDRDKDLGGGVDLVISEIFSDNLLGEGVISSLNDARNRLCLTGARFLPSKAVIRVALVGHGKDGARTRFRPIELVEGFDLSLFNRHISTRQRILIGSGDIELRSEAANLFAFDFNQALSDSGDASIQLNSKGGLVHGVAQWIWFETVEGHEYENDAQGHWQMLYYAFEQPIETRQGQAVEVKGWHDGKSLLIWNGSP